MVNKQNHSMVEYPLKLVEMDNFLLSLDSLMWKKFNKTYEDELNEEQDKTTKKLSRHFNLNSSCCCDDYENLLHYNSESDESNDQYDDDTNDDNDNDDDRKGSHENERKKKSQNNNYYRIKNNHISNGGVNKINGAHSGCQIPVCFRNYGMGCANGGDSNMTLLFIDSDVYRRNFEKSHLRLTNNMVVLDRYIVLKNLQEAYDFLNIVSNSSRWLLQGTVKLEQSDGIGSGGGGVGGGKKPRKKFQPTLFGHVNGHNHTKQMKNDSTMDILLILNSSNDFVKAELINGFRKLIGSFINETKATFEINFDKPLIEYYNKKMEKASTRLNKGENNSSTLKLVKSSIVFTNSTCDLSQSSLLTHEREHPLTGGAMMMNKADHGPSTKHKFSSIFNKIKSAFSNKNMKNSSSMLSAWSTSTSNLNNNNNNSDLNNRNNARKAHMKFSLDNLPYVICYLDENNRNHLKYASYNDEKFSNLINEIKSNKATVYENTIVKESRTTNDSINKQNLVPLDRQSSELEDLESTSSSESYSSLSDSLSSSLSTANTTTSADSSQQQQQQQLKELTDSSKSFTYLANNQLKSIKSSSRENLLSSPTSTGKYLKKGNLKNIKSISTNKLAPNNETTTTTTTTTIRNRIEMMSSISSISSLSNYITKRKKLSRSFDKLNNQPDKDQLIRERDDDCLDTSMDVSTTLTTNCDIVTDAPLKPVTRNRKELDVEEEKEAAITRHPALIRKNFLSKSMDILNGDDKLYAAKKPILKQTTYEKHKNTAVSTNQTKMVTDDDSSALEETTKLNTYLNAQMITINSISLNEQHAQQEHRIKKNICTKQSTMTNIYSKCNARNAPRTRIASPPPPIFISPNGLIAPPPPLTPAAHNLKPPAQTRAHETSLKPACMNKYQPPANVYESHSVNKPTNIYPRQHFHDDNKENFNYGRRKFHEIRSIFETATTQAPPPVQNTVNSNNIYMSHKQQQQQHQQPSNYKIDPKYCQYYGAGGEIRQSATSNYNHLNHYLIKNKTNINY